MLFLVAMGERFKVRGVRIAANTVADGLLDDGLYAVSTLRDCRSTIHLSDRPQPRTGIRRKHRALAVDPPAQGSATPTVGSASARGGR